MIDIALIDQLVQSSQPARGFFRGPRLVFLGAGLVLGAFWAKPELFTGGVLPRWIVPHIVLLVLVTLTLGFGYRQKQRAKLMVRAFESLQLQDWKQARHRLVKLLEKPVRHPRARAESLLGLAAVAESEHEYESAQHLYETLLAEENASPVQLHTARVALAAVLLREGQLADAVDLVDRLEKMDLPDPLKAQVEVLALFREVVMGQAGSEIGRAPQRRELFREYLSTRAGYGYALLAAAYNHAGQPEAAQKHWHDATLLIKPDELVRRFDELKPIAARYQATEQVL